MSLPILTRRLQAVGHHPLWRQLTFIHLSEPPSLSSSANWVMTPISQGGTEASGRKQGRSQWGQDGRGCWRNGSLTESTEGRASRSSPSGPSDARHSGCPHW